MAEPCPECGTQMLPILLESSEWRSPESTIDYERSGDGSIELADGKPNPPIIVNQAAPGQVVGFECPNASAHDPVSYSRKRLA